MMTSNGWNGHDPTLSSASQDDFQQYLDMGINSMGDGLNFDFQDFTTQQNGQILHQDGGDSMDTSMDGDVGLLARKNSMMQSHMPMPSASAHSSNPHTTVERLNSTESLVELDAQIQYLQQQRQQQQQRQLIEQQQNYYAHSRMVPPTPNSAEMHGANGQFYPQQETRQQAIFDTYQIRMKEQDLAFTPLVSPAVTPLEAFFNIPEYTVPGAYFSPLSSPALHAQNEHRTVYSRHVDTSSTTSPVDMNLDSMAAPTSAANTVRKNARKPSSSKPRTPRAVRQSPIVKPQRRKLGSTVISAQTLSELVEPALQQHQSYSGQVSTEGSENDSISPEHLSDMAPPPLPGSAGRSPYLMGQSGQKRVQQLGSGTAMSPATPASLMRLAKADQNQVSPSISIHTDMDDHLMDGFALPEAANPQPQAIRKDAVSDGQTTPTVESSTRTPGSLKAFPSPSIPSSSGNIGTSSPLLTSTNGSSTITPTIRKNPQLAVRGVPKKRPSISVSPALRPRISPSIKPLIRGVSSVSDDTASLLLASKSNYQKILEGTHLPGVSYPSELSTNLTSKRTSHKIAEQGRRNRINSALQEIATLLPKGGDGDRDAEADDAKGGNGSASSAAAAAQSANSKASTVELAIEYIKQLKREVEDANRRAEEAERKLGTENAVLKEE